MSQAEDTAEYPWDEPEPAQETFNAFGSDDDSDDEMPRTPASRRPRVGGSQGSGARGGKRNAGSEAPPGAGSTAAAVGEGSAGNGGGSSSSRDDSLRVSGREAEDGGTEGEREAGREGDDRGKRERDNDDSSSTTTAGTSALPAGDTDLEDDNRAAVRQDTDTEGSGTEEDRSTPAPARKEKLGGSSTSGVADKVGRSSSSSKQAQAETAADSLGDEAPPMTPCPMCRDEFPTPEVEAHAQRCLDEDDDVQVVDPPGTAAAAQGRGSGARGAGPPPGAAGSGSSSREGQSAAGNGSGSSEGQGAAGNGSDAGEEKCLVCGKSFPVESLQSHVNLCLDNQIKVEEEREKKENRAKRQRKSILVSRRYVPTGTRARGPRVKSEDTKADIKVEPSAAAAAAPAGGDAAVDNGAPPECSPGKPSDGVERKRSGSGSGAGRGGGAAGKRKKGSGSDRPRAQQQKEKVHDKPEGKGKGRLLPPGASGRGFKCPKKPRGCGTINTESSQRCCKCDIRLWTLVKPDG
ncbi:unnamed protein product [Ectocarpus sp. 4 AP-2014]